MSYTLIFVLIGLFQHLFDIQPGILGKQRTKEQTGGDCWQLDNEEFQNPE